MRETPETLLEETSELLDCVSPVLPRSIDALQHLVQQEVEHQEGLLQQIGQIKANIQDHLNPPKKSWESHYLPTESFHLELHPDEITSELSPLGQLPPGAARRQSYPLTVTIPGEKLPISEPSGIDTLIEVIKALGIENVRALSIMSAPIPLVAIVGYSGYEQKEEDGYHIAGNSSTVTKAVQIEVIGDMLDIRLKVEQNNLV